MNEREREDDRPGSETSFPEGGAVRSIDAEQQIIGVSIPSMVLVAP